MLRTQQPAQLSVHQREDQTLVVDLAGDWVVGPAIPSFQTVSKVFGNGVAPKAISFEVGQLGDWDSGLLTFVVKCHELCQKRGIDFDERSLPEGVARLLHLATAVPEKEDAKRDSKKPPILQRIGESTLAATGSFRLGLTFIGESIIAFGRLLRGKAQFRWSDCVLVMQECGPEAMGVVALINFLIGVILAFVGAVQLVKFGASVYVADLVAIAVTREMACIMTGIIVCGRTGAAFAAQLGTMKVNEEIDSFQTFGFSPIEFLVLPRMVALLLMMPLLCVFADLIGIAGGVAIAATMLDTTMTEYIGRTIEAISLTGFLLGIVKGSFFGVVIAMTGCLRGIQCGSNAAAVGLATTSAVVTGIAWIIASDAVFAVLCTALGI